MKVKNARVKKDKFKEIDRKIKIDNSTDKGLDLAPFTTRQDRPDVGFSQFHHPVIAKEETKLNIKKATCRDTKAREDFLGKFHIVSNNCEHFANLCRYGVKRSDQARGVRDHPARAACCVKGTGGSFWFSWEIEVLCPRANLYKCFYHLLTWWTELCKKTCATWSKLKTDVLPTCGFKGKTKTNNKTNQLKKMRLLTIIYQKRPELSPIWHEIALTRRDSLWYMKLNSDQFCWFITNPHLSSCFVTTKPDSSVTLMVGNSLLGQNLAQEGKYL